MRRVFLIVGLFLASAPGIRAEAPFECCELSIPSVLTLEIDEDVRRFLRRFNEDVEHIGERKRQRLEVARFHLEGRALRPDHEWDDTAREEMDEAMSSVFLKLLRERVKESPAVESWLLRFDSVGDGIEKSTSSWRLRVSPRVGFGSDAHWGANFSLQNLRHPLFRYLSVGFRDRSAKSETSYFVQFEDEDRYLRLQHVSSESTGDRIELNLRWRF